MGMHDGHRCRMKQRFLRYGLASFDDHNILELLLFYAIPRQDTNLVAHRLIKTFGSLAAVFEAPAEALMEVEGVGENAATLLRLIPECAQRYLMDKSEIGEIITSSADAGKFLIPRFLNSRQEEVYMICLDAKMKMIDCHAVGAGGANHAYVEISTVVRWALMQNAAAVILAHNHTSGIAIPSREDESATRRLQEALSLLGITLVDHIVVAGDDFVSMADNGFLAKKNPYALPADEKDESILQNSCKTPNNM